MLPHTLVCGPTDGELSCVAATARGNYGIDEQHGG